MMASKRRELAWICCGLSGILLVVACAPVGWWWCGWIALAPAWLALRDSEQVRQRPIRHGYAQGLLFVAGSFWWIGSAIPWAFAFMLAVLSFYPALWFLLVVRLLPLEAGTERLGFLRLLARSCLAAAFWVSLEWLRAWFLTGFNWNDLGVSQTPNACIRQLAALGGVPLLSFVLALFSILLAEAIRGFQFTGRKRWMRTGPASALGAALFVASWLYGWNHLQRHQKELPSHWLSFACIQPDIQEIPYRSAKLSELGPLESEAFHRQEGISAAAIQAQQPDLLIWPEAITGERLGTDHLVGQVVGNVMHHITGDFLLGAEELDSGKLHTGAYLFRHGESAPQKYWKIHLVVLSEYSPLRQLFPDASDAGFTPGDRPALFSLSLHPLTLSPFICHEETQPELVAAAARLRPDFFVVLINDDWFTGIPAFWELRQQLQNSVLRTVEHDRPMIRCGNNGISCEIDPDGNVVACVQTVSGKLVDVPGILLRKLPILPAQVTPYERWGNWVVRISQLLTILALIWHLIRKERPSRIPRS